MGDEEQRMREALKRVATVLKPAQVRFALAGGYAAWARGGPEPEHDVDFVVAPDDVDAAEKALRDADVRVEHPTEDWLVKAYPDDVLVDLIFAPTGLDLDAGVFDRVDLLDVDSVRMPVLSATDLVVAKLAALDEHYCDFSRLLPVVRALREQVDWPAARATTGSNDFAAAFFFLTQRLGVLAS